MSRILSIRQFIISGILTLCLAACGEEKPDFLIPQDKIVPILKDMQIGYAGIDLTVANEKIRSQKYAELNALILDKYRVNADTFFMSYNYYQDHPEVLDSIYLRVIEELNLEMIPLQQKNAPNRRKIEDT